MLPAVATVSILEPGLRADHRVPSTTESVRAVALEDVSCRCTLVPMLP